MVVISPCFLVCAIIQLIAGGCDRHNRRIELWLNIDNPHTWIGKKPRDFVAEDATIIADGRGFAMFRSSAAFISFDVLVAHAPHSARPEQARADYWRSIEASVQARRHMNRSGHFSC